MNTLKFSKLCNKTTEQHNLEVIDIEETTLFGKNISMFYPCNLNIFITNICQNHCSFCINKDYSGTDIKDDLYFKALCETLKELKDKDIEITITGGEPSLNVERFVKTMKICKEYGKKCRTVSTTGIGLLQEYEGKTLCQHMIDNGFIHNISISRMAYEEDKNRDIFQGSKNLTNQELERLRIFFKLNKAELRLSCNILDRNVNNLEKILDFVEKYKKFDAIMFREIVGGTIKLSDIVEFDDRFSYVETLHGIYYNVDIYVYKDYLIKYYKSKRVDKNMISSLSLRNGVLMKDFKEEIKDFNE